MPTGLDGPAGGWVNAPTDLPGFGDVQWESMSGRDYSRPIVGGQDWGQDMTGFNPTTGFERIVTGSGSGLQPVPGPGGRKVTDWRYALNPDSPTFWILVFTLAAIGILHARVSVKAGRLGRVAGGIG